MVLPLQLSHCSSSQLLCHPRITAQASAVRHPEPAEDRAVAALLLTRQNHDSGHDADVEADEQLEKSQMRVYSRHDCPLLSTQISSEYLLCAGPKSRGYC